MSCWTHVVGVMHVDTHREVPDIEEFVREKLKHAPMITGSEGPAAVFVNAEPGHNIWTSADCGRCEYSNTSCYECDPPGGFQCPSGHYQSRVVITIQGDLRDRMRAQTRKEWNAFHRYVAKELGFNIRVATCKINGW